MILNETIDIEHIDDLIKSHMAFIIRTTSNFTGRYITIENDDEFSIALLAFQEAVEKYDEKKGSFLSYAKLVIESRLLNFAERKSNQNKPLSLDILQEQVIESILNCMTTICFKFISIVIKQHSRLFFCEAWHKMSN